MSVKSFKNINARNLDLEILQEIYHLNLLTRVRNTRLQRDPLQHQAECDIPKVNEGGDHKGSSRLITHSDKGSSQVLLHSLEFRVGCAPRPAVCLVQLRSANRRQSPGFLGFVTFLSTEIHA